MKIRSKPRVRYGKVRMSAGKEDLARNSEGFVMFGFRRRGLRSLKRWNRRGVLKDVDKLAHHL